MGLCAPPAARASPLCARARPARRARRQKTARDRRRRAPAPAHPAARAGTARARAPAPPPPSTRHRHPLTHHGARARLADVAAVSRKYEICVRPSTRQPGPAGMPSPAGLLRLVLGLGDRARARALVRAPLLLVRHAPPLVECEPRRHRRARLAARTVTWAARARRRSSRASSSYCTVRMAGRGAPPAGAEPGRCANPPRPCRRYGWFSRSTSRDSAAESGSRGLKSSSGIVCGRARLTPLRACSTILWVFRPNAKPECAGDSDSTIKSRTRALRTESAERALPPPRRDHERSRRRRVQAPVPGLRVGRAGEAEGDRDRARARERRRVRRPRLPVRRRVAVPQPVPAAQGLAPARDGRLEPAERRRGRGLREPADLHRRADAGRRDAGRARRLLVPLEPLGARHAPEPRQAAHRLGHEREEVRHLHRQVLQGRRLAVRDSARARGARARGGAAAAAERALSPSARRAIATTPRARARIAPRANAPRAGT